MTETDAKCIAAAPPIDAVRTQGTLKRGLDIVLSAIAMVALLPVFIVVAIAIKLDSSGPVFYTQKRIGRGFRPFRLYKFRTMEPNADRRGPLITRSGDARINRVGRVLRKSKLDEIPQLLNILKGEMSLVGPRPEVPPYVDLFRGDYKVILSRRPGLTDLASIVYRDEEDVLAAAADPEREYIRSILPEKIRLAKLYIENSSLGLDAKIIAKTLLRVVQCKR